MSISVMNSSNLLNPIIPSDSSSDLKRRRYLEDIELLDSENNHDSKRIKIENKSTVSSPQLASSNPILDHNHSSPAHSYTSPVLSKQIIQVNTSSPSTNLNKATIPPLSSVISGIELPDTSNENWRLNLNTWIEQNFPDRHQNLKNLLKLDKPGFDLLNDAIIITELKEQLSTETPSFKSKFSKTFYSQPSFKNESFSDDESEYHNTYQKRQQHLSSPILQNLAPFSSFATPKPTSASSCSSSLPFESNYTYSSSLKEPLSPSSKFSQTILQPASNLTNSVQLPPIRSEFKALPFFSHNQGPIYHQQHHSNATILASPSTLPSEEYKANSEKKYPVASKSVFHKHHHKQDHKHDHQASIVSSSKNFVHTQNHKGPNHTYTIHQHSLHKRKCISCGSDQSPCWRPSWSVAAGQLCNSCGLRYKKTGARCLSESCGRIPAKGEWTAMKNRGKVNIISKTGQTIQGYKCLHCGGEVEVKEKS
ncbi:hypothetical protein WICMUC_002812 [Wickerhamomyces mucosus]|uniref:GATA-type domain-containing protein n=1 Tax=Wickerhamomyces mucosus TaxID=1378264 RepID=A0A9P8TE97_9ASCO|nr:hypothetical protein WICMUC_002812 [Wickerhamomyces mucosus]